MSVERTRGGKAVLINTSGVIIDLTLADAEELRKQLDEALKDPLDGYGLPWRMNDRGTTVDVNGYAINDKPWETYWRAITTLSEAEQREFLMRGLDK